MATSSLTKSSTQQRLTENMVMIVAVLGTAMVYLDQTAVTVALPRIQVALNTDIGGLQWIIDIYILTLASLLLIGGALGDRYGRVRLYAMGTVIFTLASAACGVAQTLGFLVAARAIQGAGGALIVPAGLAIINATAAPERRGRLIGTWATFTSMVIAFGPSLGGWLVDNVSWRAIFFINLPLGVIACYVAMHHVPESRNEESSDRLDWPGAVVLMLGLGSLLFGLIEGPHLGWGSPLIVAALTAGILLLVGFIIIEARSPAPMMPLVLFRNPTFSGINLMTLIQWMSLTGILFFLTLNLQQVQGYSAFAAGLTFLPISLSIIFLSKPVGKLTDRLGPQPLLITGLLVTGLSFLLFMRAGIEESYWPILFPATLVFGLGMGITIVPVTTVAMGALPNQHSGIASGLNNTASRIAFMLGIAVLGTVMLISFRAALVERTATLPLASAARIQLLAEARNLGTTTPPPDLAPEVAQATSQAIRLAFVDSFRRIMFLCLIISLVSVGITLAYGRLQPVTLQVTAESHSSQSSVAG
jgi:EmrB/QacA subfamily drug resistance transporter